MVAGLLDLYEVQAEPGWLVAAKELQTRLTRDHGDPTGGFFRSGAGDEELWVREKRGLEDGALPSGNGVAALNLLRLAALSGEAAYREAAEATLRAFATAIGEHPTQAGALLLALGWIHDEPPEVIIVLPRQGAGGEALLGVLRRVYRPHRVQVIVREGDALDANAALVSLLRGKKARDGKATAYVCVNRTCRFPTTDPETFEHQLLAGVAEE